MNNTITGPHLIEAIGKETGVTSETAEKFVSEFFDIITESLCIDKTVSIDGIGQFLCLDKNSISIQYIPDKKIAATINEPFAAFEPVELADDVTDETLCPTSEQDTDDVKTMPEIENVKTNEASIPKEDLPEKPSDSDVISDDRNTPELQHNIQPDIDLKQDNIYINQKTYNDDDTGNIIYHTRGWPIVIGVIVGFITGAIIGFLMHDSINEMITRKDVQPQDSSITKPSDAIDTVAVILVNPTDTISNAIDSTPIPSDNYIQATYDTVSTNRFLATMAREHYGVMEFWIYIFEENKDILPSNPNRITPGTRVLIPQIDKYVKGTDHNKARSDAQKRILELEQELRENHNSR